MPPRARLYSPVTAATPLKRSPSSSPFSRLPNQGEVDSLGAMQRLFTMFPLGSVGIGLLLLRLSTVSMLLMLLFSRALGFFSQWVLTGLASLAVFFVLGAFTPVLCILCGCLEIAALFSLRGGDALYMVLTLVNTAALGLLGPGGYSLDARMFGRRRLILSTDDYDVN
jgi:hypothetical protein